MNYFWTSFIIVSEIRKFNCIGRDFTEDLQDFHIENAVIKNREVNAQNKIFSIKLKQFFP